MSVPSANTTFDKTTPEKVWESAGQSYWLSANGGTVTGNVTVTGVLTVPSVVAQSVTTTSLSATSGSIGSLTVSGTINQGVVGYPSFVNGITLTGSQINPLTKNAISTSAVAMAVTAVTYTTAGSVTFTVNNTSPFYIGQTVSVSGTTNWNGNFIVTSYATGAVTCSTSSTFATENPVTATMTPLYNAGLYAVTALVKITQSVAPTAGSATEGISMGFDIASSAPANYTQTVVQATNNPLYTITGQYGQATFSMVGTVRCTNALSKLWLITSAGSQTGTYGVVIPQVCVTPIGLFRS